MQNWPGLCLFSKVPGGACRVGKLGILPGDHKPPFFLCPCCEDWFYTLFCPCWEDWVYTLFICIFIINHRLFLLFNSNRTTIAVAPLGSPSHRISPWTCWALVLKWHLPSAMLRCQQNREGDHREVTF